MTLKQSYIALLKKILQENNLVENYLENMGESITFDFDKIDELKSDKRIADDLPEMEKVFFTNQPNKFGHNYGSAVLTPISGESDIIKATTQKIQGNLETRNAVLTFIPYGNNKIPCISTIQFLIRNNILNIFYTARSQDIYKKFPLDALCIADMGLAVAKNLNLNLGYIKANIISAHIYQCDIIEAKKFIEENK